MNKNNLKIKFWKYLPIIVIVTLTILTMGISAILATPSGGIPDPDW
ncbi:MAG: hypothetical protein ACFE9L_03195 [Candidatus Hodarchaeota archaeon]